MGSSGGILPVIVIPHAVNFYLGDQKTYKQVLTIYNVYDSAIRFQVLGTDPSKYRVVEPQGSIKPNCSLDIVVRHIDVRPSNCNITDKFRIQFLEYTTKKYLGRKDVTATLYSGVPDNDDNDEDGSASHISRSTDRFLSETRNARNFATRDHSVSVKPRAGPNAFIVSVAIVCIAALFLPIEGEKSVIPLQISFSLKLVFAYVLGLVTMVILKS